MSIFVLGFINETKRMFFKDIIGQDETKVRLIQEARQHRVAHAQMLCGHEGVGKFAMALAYARYLCCQHPTDTDACGTCPSCVKFNKLAHPDLHFVFPTINKRKAGADKDITSDTFLPEWRDMLAQSPYFNLDIWLAAMGAENQQAIIGVKESDALLRKLSLKSSQGGYKIAIVWLPEKMNLDCANKMLKLLEEPPEQTLFLLVSENPDQLLPTILSRVQRINLHGLPDADMTNAMQRQFGIGEEDACRIAHIANGNWLKALQCIYVDEDHKQFLQYFISLMRLAYQRQVHELKLWSETIAALGREKQKNFLTYCQHLVRNNFVFNLKDPGMVYMNADEEAFAQRFAPFINEGNVINIMNELADAQRHIEGNVNAKMVFFDFALRMIVQLITKRQ